MLREDRFLLNEDYFKCIMQLLTIHFNSGIPHKNKAKKCAMHQMRFWKKQEMTKYLFIIFYTIHGSLFILIE